MINFNNSPIEQYKCKGIGIYVKREDLCCVSPMPPLAKMRGVYKYLKKQSGLIGNIDTSVSKSGQGIAVICNNLHLPYNYYCPQLKGENIFEKEQVRISKNNNANIIPMQATRLSIFFARAKKHVENEGGIMLPVGLPFFETAEEVAKQILITDSKLLKGTIILATGTGTILSGILCGLLEAKIIPFEIIGISAGMSIKKQIKLINKNIDIYTIKHNNFDSFILKYKLLNSLKLIKSNRNYYENTPVKIPFPAHNTYEGKAWEYLEKNIQNLKQPILFWNIGS